MMMTMIMMKRERERERETTSLLLAASLSPPFLPIIYKIYSIRYCPSREPFWIFGRDLTHTVTLRERERERD
tara:strand:- start:1157 stop:1372 length:216 start_codon:yes stop_codon:yes gene_type:complete